jgi:hypothetical protein
VRFSPLSQLCLQLYNMFSCIMFLTRVHNARPAVGWRGALRKNSSRRPNKNGTSRVIYRDNYHAAAIPRSLQPRGFSLNCLSISLWRHIYSPKGFVRSAKLPYFTAIFHAHWNGLVCYLKLCGARPIALFRGFILAN